MPDGGSQKAPEDISRILQYTIEVSDYTPVDGKNIPKIALGYKQVRSFEVVERDGGTFIEVSFSSPPVPQSLVETVNSLAMDDDTVSKKFMWSAVCVSEEHEVPVVGDSPMICFRQEIIGGEDMSRSHELQNLRDRLKRYKVVSDIRVGYAHDANGDPHIGVVEADFGNDRVTQDDIVELRQVIRDEMREDQTLSEYSIKTA